MRRGNRCHPNHTKLVWLVKTLNLTARQVAESSGWSRPYVQRIIGGDFTVGTPEFFAAVERNLHKLVEARGRSFFETPVVNVAELPMEFQNTLAKCA